MLPCLFSLLLTSQGRASHRVLCLGRPLQLIRYMYLHYNLWESSHDHSFRSFRFSTVTHWMMLLLLIHLLLLLLLLLRLLHHHHHHHLLLLESVAILSKILSHEYLILSTENLYLHPFFFFQNPNLWIEVDIWVWIFTGGRSCEGGRPRAKHMGHILTQIW